MEQERTEEETLSDLLNIGLTDPFIFKPIEGLPYELEILTFDREQMISWYIDRVMERECQKFTDQKSNLNGGVL